MDCSHDPDPNTPLDPEGRFLQLLVANERRIHAYIASLVPIWADADDLFQETSVVLWRKARQFEPGTDFVAWALSIARYQVLDYRKKQGRARALFSDQTIEGLADQAESLVLHTDDRRDALEACLARLNERDRELIQLRYQPGATTPGVADRTGRSLKAVYKALNRIHYQLLQCINRTLAAKVIP
jgi:RNA polymerase sigma-70 factor (ECF subfamily)